LPHLLRVRSHYKDNANAWSQRFGANFRDYVVIRWTTGLTSLAIAAGGIPDAVTGGNRRAGARASGSNFLVLARVLFRKNGTALNSRRLFSAYAVAVAQAIEKDSRAVDAIDGRHR